ncbi:PUR family DNA/RNA-binding protein [uncultured Bacteroides sp.]|uniref:PUR family DNA/RNA-binding protein n=1 Tax=uncultured Bacteroides sp. TaxID=162156 RepID=UPI002626C14C|nr:PUR family DNA/RNA-binding protein [uncultured Bacteroides sp.]
MEEEWKKKNGGESSDKEILYSQAIKAGKRIYYLDVKKNRKDEMFLAITESKKIISGEGEESQVSFEKHKIFLYQEDFDKFMNGLKQSISFIQEQQGTCIPKNENKEADTSQNTSVQQETAGSDTAALAEGEIKIDIDF